MKFGIVLFIGLLNFFTVAASHADQEALELLASSRAPLHEMNYCYIDRHEDGDTQLFFNDVLIFRGEKEKARVLLSNLAFGHWCVPTFSPSAGN